MDGLAGAATGAEAVADATAPLTLRAASCAPRARALRGAHGDTYLVRHEKRSDIWKLTMFRAARVAHTSHHIKPGHHAVILVFQIVAMQKVAAPISVEPGNHAHVFIPIHSYRVLPARFVRQWRPARRSAATP